MSAIIFKFQDVFKIKKLEQDLLNAGYDYIDICNDLAFEEMFGYPMSKENPERYQALLNLSKRMAPKNNTSLPLSNWNLEE